MLHFLVGLFKAIQLRFKDRERINAAPRRAVFPKTALGMIWRDGVQRDFCEDFLPLFLPTTPYEEFKKLFARRGKEFAHFGKNLQDETWLPMFFSFF